MRLRCIVSTLVLVAWSASALAADPMPRAKPEEVGLSSERLARIGDVLKADVERGRMPGAVLAIARRGKLVHLEAYGFLDKAAGTPMRTDAIFSIASMTKPMTTVGALVLYEQTKILLNDPVAKYLPALGKMQVGVQPTRPTGRTIVDPTNAQVEIDREPPQKPMRIQDLMRHTSGLTYGGRGNTAVHKLYPGGSSEIANKFAAKEFIAALAQLPLLHQPGTTWDYSFSTDVLGIIVEAVSETTLGRYLDDTLFKPLGMADTGFLIPADKVARYAKALPNDPDSGRPQSVLDLSKPVKLECGGACAASTAGDYIRFGQMLLNKGEFGGKRILARKTVELMTSDHLGPEIKSGPVAVDAGRAGYGFGLGLAVRRTDGVSPLMGSAGDYTWGGAFGTNFWVDPKEQLVVVFMAHTPGPMRLHYRQVVNTLVMQALLD